jgi:hypothetical protein
LYGATAKWFTDVISEIDGKEDADPTILKEADVIDNLTSTDTDKPLSANQGKVLEDNKVDTSAIVNDLTTGGTTVPLSAEQGKVLNDTKPSFVSANLTITVGSGGDHSNLNEALADASKLYPLYVNEGFTVEIKLLSGFEMEEQVLVRGIDLSWITITSEDAEVTIIRSDLTQSFGRFSHRPAFGGDFGAKLPVIDCLFNMDSSGDSENRHGIAVYRVSTAIVLEGGGFVNCSGRGILSDSQSKAYAREGKFYGAGDYAAMAHDNAFLDVRLADCSNSNNGVSGENASMIAGDGVDVSGATNKGIRIKEGCFCTFGAADASNCGDSALEAIESSVVHAGGINASNSGSASGAIVASEGTVINAENANASGASDTAIRALKGSIVNANGANATNSGNASLRAFQGSKINAHQSDISGAVSRAVDARDGSTVNVRSSDGGNKEVRVRDGSLINANGMTDFNGSQSTNTLTSSGIIFR